MSVKINQLTKIYGSQKAVDNLSFEVNKGEILGFLGPNGAGKTTTMKILTCFIPQTSGTAEVCGYDTTTNSIDVRREIGYLPEHNPLYKDMYVREYLTFVAGLHKISNPKNRVEEMIETTGLTREQNKLIGALSKGYRQRVGLAQAMMHDPQVLILDEPTSGLDPNQLVDIRRLIKDLGKEKTVIFSTHIMQEVQAICDRVLIINKGKAVANEEIGALQNMMTGGVKITIELKEKVDADFLTRIKGVQRAHAVDAHTWELTAKNEGVREAIFRHIVTNQLTLLGMQKMTKSVENVFQELTKD